MEGSVKLVSAKNKNRPFEKKTVGATQYILSNGDELIIEDGFTTDIASVPRQLILTMVVSLFVVSSYLSQQGGDLAPFILSAVATLLCVGLYNSGRALMDESAFVLHDWLFENKKVHGYSLQFCDREMLYQMEQDRFSKLRPKIMYLGVRAFSWWYWYDCADKLKKLHEKI